ncbi:hypothetical protein H257_02955 [Aphanomyces astaci]|uniref:Uncharacterized protein n=1 Tax=Aphanomyces astaci TaxID=112090 RepID=W4GZN4_APHAT|nr:hypothetical protein H257_02955 [Aphanomyces astaci]ETV85097.1 hypothetical protein H257_02955 [Aphanomyces astaci]|eukprot:XP_009825115.1 hypothetical protein H257_02955 [Aphanomyces astaci]
MPLCCLTIVLVVWSVVTLLVMVLLLPVVTSLQLFALNVILTGVASSPGNRDTPSSAVYRTGSWSSATSSCIPYQDYFACYVPCALSLTVGNGSKLPVVGYAFISMETLMSVTDVTLPMVRGPTASSLVSIALN